MKPLTAAAVLALLCLYVPGGALADDDSARRWWYDERREPYWAGPCEVKLESKPRAGSAASAIGGRGARTVTPTKGQDTSRPAR